MGSPLVLKRVLLLLFWISSCCFFTTLLGLLVPCLLVLFPCGIVLLSFLLEPLSGFCLLLVMLLQLMTIGDHAAHDGEVGVAGRSVGFSGVSSFGKKRFRTKQKNTSAPRKVSYACSSTRVEKVALFWISRCF